VEAVLALVRSRPETTEAVTRGAARLLTQLGYAPLLEAPLPNGRRADILALGPKGDLLIVEVKSSLEDYRADGKWPEYQPYCDSFSFAVGPDFPRHILPEGPASSAPTPTAGRCWSPHPWSRWPPPAARR
jgi:hypothetical protein